MLQMLRQTLGLSAWPCPLQTPTVVALETVEVTQALLWLERYRQTTPRISGLYLMKLPQVVPSTCWTTKYLLEALAGLACRFRSLDKTSDNGDLCWGTYFGRCLDSVMSTWVVLHTVSQWRTREDLKTYAYNPAALTACLPVSPSSVKSMHTLLQIPG
jgi:hypothetical protein